MVLKAQLKSMKNILTSPIQPVMMCEGGEEKICALIRATWKKPGGWSVTDYNLSESTSHYLIHPCEHTQINVSCLAPEADPLN